MRKLIRTLLCLCLAALVPAILIAAIDASGSVNNATLGPYSWLRLSNLFMLCLVISSAHVFALGLPSFVILYRLQLANAISSVIAGFLLGSAPIAIYSWPLRFPNNQSADWDGQRMVPEAIHGVPTLTTWFRWLESLCVMGLFGTVAGLVFWLAWRRGMRPNNSFKPKPLRGSA